MLKDEARRKEISMLICWWVCMLICAHLFSENNPSVYQVMFRIFCVCMGPILLMAATFRGIAWFSYKDYEREYANFKSIYYKSVRNYYAYDRFSSKRYVRQLKRAGRRLVNHGNELIDTRGITKKQKEEIQETMKNAVALLHKFG